MRVNSVRSISKQVSWFALFVALAFVLGSTQPVWALITGGEGNAPVSDPGWPKGAAAVFNTQFRVAHWEGPPFGGGQYHGECRGDTAAFQQVLNDFAKIDTSFKRVVVHDGVGHSFWLNPNREKDKNERSKIDWLFMVWRPESRNRQRRLPVDLSAIGRREPAVLAQLDVYAGGSIRWADVTLPEGIDVVDQRLEAHGFTLDDGTVLEGKAIDAATGQPIKANLLLERIEPQEKGGYLYTKIAVAPTDADGHWVLKNVPQAWCRLVLTADGYASRRIAYGQYDIEPHWSEHNSELSKSGTIAGRVFDHQGRPLADVDVRISGVEVKNAGGYEAPDDSAIKTDADGRFSSNAFPIGTATVRVYKPGYVTPGLGTKIEMPETEIKVEMQLAAKIRIIVDFSAARREGGYLVHVEPEGGEKIGKWSADGEINADNLTTYEHIPAGKYVVSGRPNPGRTTQQTDPVTVELKGGETTEVTIKAK